MIPLRIRVAGLHSFRQEQSLDFGDVLGHGVFGIFGPTGSGKSTVLDAITLALYGRVSRAPSGTSGICNQAEDRVEVDFSFALEGPDGRREYRAQRSYARQPGTDSLRTAKCRFSEVGGPGGDRVLAEKEREMTGLVEETLGLPVEDFTRAVVLPQGRFSEFLGLAGAERRRMLQRLFDLERYGDALAARVKERLDGATSELAAVAAEQAGLGDASASALSAAERAAAAAGDAADAAEVVRRAARAEAQAQAQIWGWQEDLGPVRDGEARLVAEEPDVRRAEAELRSAERAEGARPLLQAAAEARGALEVAARLAEAAAEAAARAAEAAAEARRARDEARGRRAERQGPLQQRRAALAAAVRLEEDLAAVRGRHAGAEAAARAAEGHRDAAEQAAAGTEAARASARARADEAGRSLEGVQVGPEERAAVDAAARAHAEHRRAAAAREAAERPLAAAEVEVARREAAASEATGLAAAAQGAYAAAHEGRLALSAAAPQRADAGPWAEALGAADRAVQGLREAQTAAAAAEGAVCAAEGVLAAALDARQAAEAAAVRAAEALTDARAALDAATVRGLAGSLAAHLADGSPCPVCGSPHHPSPAAVDPDADRERAAAEREVRRLERLARETQTAAAAAAAGQGAAEATAAAERRTAGRAREAVEAARAELRRRAAALPEQARGLEPEVLAAYLREETDALERARAAQGQWEEARAGAEAREREALQAMLDRQAAAAERDIRAAGARSARDAAVDAHRGAAAEEAAAAAALEAARGGWADEEIARRRQDMERRDREAGSLLLRLRHLSGEAEAVDRAAEAARAEAGRAQVEAAARRQGERALGAEAERLGGDLARALGDGAVGTAAAALRAVDEDLAALAQAEDRAHRGAEAAEAVLGEARTAEGASGAELAGARRQAQAAARRSADALAAAGFDGEEAAVAALREPAALAELRRRVEEHARQRLRLGAERERLERLLAGRAVTGAEREAGLHRVDAAEEAARNAQEALGVARQALEAVTARHGRWRALEARRAALTGDRDALTDLAGVLRGGAFVEFVAEEQLRAVALDASARLGQLTHFRYALEVDAQGGFRVRDDWNGGARRPVSTLSGGETFLTSLALALALSAQIQLRGRYPLRFFFLDEGFGTLDPETLDTALGALEELQGQSVHIGVISHVPEVRERLARRVVVEPAEPGGRGSRLRVEVA